MLFGNFGFEKVSIFHILVLWFDVKADDVSDAIFFGRLDKGSGAAGWLEHGALDEVWHMLGYFVNQGFRQFWRGIELLFTGGAGIAQAWLGWAFGGHAYRLTTNGLV